LVLIIWIPLHESTGGSALELLFGAEPLLLLGHTIAETIAQLVVLWLRAFLQPPRKLRSKLAQAIGCGDRAGLSGGSSTFRREDIRSGPRLYLEGGLVYGLA